MYNQSAQLDFLLASRSSLPPTATVHQVYLPSLINCFDLGVFLHFGQRQPPERETAAHYAGCCFLSLIEQGRFPWSSKLAHECTSTITFFCKENSMSNDVTLKFHCCTKRFRVVWMCLKSNKNIQLWIIIYVRCFFPQKCLIKFKKS